MKTRWSILISLSAMLTLMVASFLPASWASIDVSSMLSQGDAVQMTPVADIESWSAPTPVTPVNATTDGMTAVDTLKAWQASQQAPLPPAPMVTAAAMGSGMSDIQEVSTDAAPSAAPAPELAFAIFPVVQHASMEKAFSDLPVVLSTAVAQQLTARLRTQGLAYEVLNPIYTYDALRQKGMSSVYQEMVHDFLDAGQPNEKDVQFLADQLSTPTRRVQWVVFVSAEFDPYHTVKPVGLQIPMARFYDTLPGDPNFFVNGEVQFFSTDDGMPLLWRAANTQKIAQSAFSSFSKSIMADSNSSKNFKAASMKMAQKMLAKLPTPTSITSTAVQANLVTPASPSGAAMMAPPTPAYASQPQSSSSVLTPADQDALRRIIQRNEKP